MAGEVTITGLEDAMKAMQAAFPKDPRQQKRLVASAMRRSAATTFVAHAKQLATTSERSGALAESIGVRYMQKRDVSPGSVVGLQVTTVRKSIKAMAMYASFYRVSAKQAVEGIRHGHLIEFGHAKRGGNGDVSARPFLGPAMDSGFSPYVNRFAADLGKKIEAAVRRKAKKARK